MSFLILLTCIFCSAISFSQSLNLKDLSAFRNPGPSWKIAGDVRADPDKEHNLTFFPGTGILVNAPDKQAADLFTQAEFGDLTLELDFMMAPGSNSGIYLQGRYEFQLMDNWGDLMPDQHGNGALYQRWHEGAPEGKQGYEGHAPRVNASKAPGTWQHVRILFQAPRFENGGKKIAAAKILSAELNGVLIHENLELTGPTRGAIDSTETPKGPLRFQGDHGAVAFRNIRTGALPATDTAAQNKNEDEEQDDPIMVDAGTATIHRSFMDLAGAGRLTHAISVGTPQQVHFTYDPMTGMLMQAWHGEFLDATPMWHDRGNGTARPRGALQLFGKPAPALSTLAQTQSAWPVDTSSSGFKPKGYTIDESGMPTFRYRTLGMNVTDRIRPLEKSHGLHRELTVDAIKPNLFMRVAASPKIEKVNDGLFLIDDKSYYLQFDTKNGIVPQVRDNTTGLKELIIPVTNATIVYNILF